MMSAEPHRRSAHGFSLAESLIAIAIVSFSLLTIIGMMPPGLDHLKNSEDRAARARIISTLAAEYEAMNWAELQRVAGKKRGPIYYDRQGLETNKQVEQIYGAEVLVSKGNTSLEALPGTNPSPFLTRVEIKVTSRPQANNPFGTGNELGLELRTLMLVNTEAQEGRLVP